MKNNYLFGMFAATGMLLATSCSNDELEVAQSGNEAQVTFSLGLENGIGSRAISDGTQANKLVYAVFDSKGTPLFVFDANKDGVYEHQKTETIKNITGESHNVSITLAKGQTYQVAFWAQDDDCKAYNTDDLKNVMVDYKNAANNADVRDAFFKSVEFTVAGNKTIDVVMKRPFAQINVGVYESDWDAAVASGIEIEKSKVVINNAATSINLLTGAVSGTETVTYDLSAIPNETLEVETDETKAGKEEYKWLSMSYILVADNSTTDEDKDGTLGDARTTLESLNYTFSPVSGNPITFAEGLNSVPVQRNWRTNILGKILTGDIQFNITIDPVYDGDINYPDNTEGAAQEVEFVATFGGTVNATADADLGARVLNVTGDAIFNMNGYNLKVAEGQVSTYGIKITDGYTAVFNDANIVSGGVGISVQGGANVTFNGGSICSNTSGPSASRYIFYAAQDGSAITINGGSFSFAKLTKRTAYICADVNAKVYVKGGDFGERHKDKEPIVESGNGEVIITGGTFGFDPSEWVAAGYKAIAKDKKWYVVAEEIKKVATSGTELSEALKNGENVALASNIAVSKSEAESNGYGVAGISQLNGGIIDGNGNNISVNAWTTWDSAINTTGGTIKNVNVTGGMRGIFINHNSTNNSKVILENVTIDGTVYTISCDQGTNKGLEAYNSTFNGWTSYAATIGDVKFVDCKFGEGQGYAYCRPYAPTEFIGCEFAAGFELDAVAAVSFENCTIGGVTLTDANLSTLVTSGIANATVK